MNINERVIDYPPYKKIVIKLVKVRKEIGITQAQVDQMIGCADGLVSKWECGDRIPSFFMLVCWLESLGVELQIKKVDN
jgi:transcriptional regulator with XRE-family HTH domain